MITDEELITKALAGDQDAYTELYKRTLVYTGKGVGKYLLNHCSYHDAPHDIATKIIMSLHSFKATARFQTWAYRITFNECMMLLRSNRIRLAKSVELDAPRFEEGEMTLGDTIADTRNGHNATESRIDVQRCLERLAPGYREVLVNRHIFGFTHVEVATRLERTVGNIKSQSCKGAQRAREISYDLYAYAKDKKFHIPDTGIEGDMHV